MRSTMLLYCLLVANLNSAQIEVRLGFIQSKRCFANDTNAFEASLFVSSGRSLIPRK